MAKNKQKPVSLPSLTNQISFNLIDCKFTLRDRGAIRSWVRNAVLLEGKKLDELSFNFCSDEHLLGINKQFLKHDYYTDIITFDLSEEEGILGDIYISIDRVRENAKQNGAPFHVELKRVMIHGVLHLCGLNDKTAKERLRMREKEDHYLSLWPL